MAMTKGGFTRNGHNMFEVSSLIQKAIRRRDADLAYYAANELIPKYRNYCWKRLLTVSAEDCYDMVTGRIMELHTLDTKEKDDRNIATAVSTLLNARKNRDADYFACNLLNSRDVTDITKYCPEPKNDMTCHTKNGHCLYDLETCFRNAVDAVDDKMAGYSANEILVYYRKTCWRLIIGKAEQMGFADVVAEMRALKAADEQTKRCSIIYYAKAITTLLKVAKWQSTDNFEHTFKYNDTIDLRKYDSVKYMIPSYVFDCHTYRGKAMGKTRAQFFADEQAALTPLQLGWYDNMTYDRFLWLEKNGFWKDAVLPRPDERTIKEIEEGTAQLSLF